MTSFTSQNQTNSPFAIEAKNGETFTVIKGARNGYIQLATSAISTQYANLPLSLFEAAKAWAAILETHGAQRVYWLTLSEVVTHLHIHLYPRWPEDTEKGLPLFESRDTSPQPAWTPALNDALDAWAKQYKVYIKPASI